MSSNRNLRVLPVLGAVILTATAGIAIVAAIVAHPSGQRPIHAPVPMSRSTVGHTSQAPSPSPSPSRAKDEADYLEVLRTTGTPGQRWYFTQQKDTSLIEIGRKSCGALDSGLTVEEALSALTAGGLGPVTAGEVLGAASFFLCPSHRQEVSDWANRTEPVTG